MNEAIRRRVLYQARIMLDNKLTVREVAKIIGLSKSTIHKDLTEKLKLIDEYLFDEIANLLEYNKNIRAVMQRVALRMPPKKRTVPWLKER